MSRITLELGRNDVYRCPVELNIAFGNSPDITDTLRNRIDCRLDNVFRPYDQNTNLDVLVPIHHLIAGDCLSPSENTHLKQPKQH